MVLRKLNRYLKEYFGIGIFRNDFLRGALRFAIRHFNDKPVDVVEIGTYKGINARHILRKLNIKNLYVIDSWDNYAEYNEYKNESLRKIYSLATKLLKEDIKSGKVIVIRDCSENAYNVLKNKKFDYIYIDGNHDYEYIKRDISLFYPLVKEGGILAGHDIDFSGVLQAVSEFFNKHRLKLNAQSGDWWIIKGKK